MTGTLAIAAKELRSYLLSPMAWGLAAVFLCLSGLEFYHRLSLYGAQSAQWMQYSDVVGHGSVNRLVFEPTFYKVAMIHLLLVPMVTMGLLAEERRSGTLQLLLASPVRLGAVVLGKYLAAVALLTAMLLLTFYMPLLAWRFGALEWGLVGSTYLGLVLFSAAFAAWGLFASGVSETPLVAAMLSFGLLLGCWALGWAGQMGGNTAAVLTHLSVVTHLRGFLRGVVETREVVYYVSVGAFGLFLTHRALDASRRR